MKATDCAKTTLTLYMNHTQVERGLNIQTKHRVCINCTWNVYRLHKTIEGPFKVCTSATVEEPDMNHALSVDIPDTDLVRLIFCPCTNCPLTLLGLKTDCTQAKQH